MTLAGLTAANLPIDTGKRCFPRARLNLPARLVTFNGTSDCTLVDLSRSGAKLGASETPRVGAMVVVEGLPIELFGNVRWSVRGLFGLEFDVPLPLERVVEMRHYADGEEIRRKREQLAYARNWVQGAI